MCRAVLHEAKHGTMSMALTNSQLEHQVGKHLSLFMRGL